MWVTWVFTVASLSRRRPASSRLFSPRANEREHLQPVHLGHPDVHQHHARAQPAHRRDRLHAVGCLPDSFDPGRLEDHREPGPYQFLVVGDHHTWLGHAEGSSGIIFQFFNLLADEPTGAVDARRCADPDGAGPPARDVRQVALVAAGSQPREGRGLAAP